MTWISRSGGRSASTSSRKRRKSSRFLDAVNWLWTWPSADFQGGKKMQRPMSLASAFQHAYHLATVSLHITGGAFDGLEARLLLHA